MRRDSPPKLVLANEPSRRYAAVVLVTVVVSGPAGENWIQVKFPTEPLEALASIFRRRTCWPAGRLTPVLVIVVHVCQPPVLGIVIGPVTSPPSISMWNFPLLPV